MSTLFKIQATSKNRYEMRCWREAGNAWHGHVSGHKNTWEQQDQHSFVAAMERCGFDVDVDIVRLPNTDWGFSFQLTDYNDLSSLCNAFTRRVGKSTEYYIMLGFGFEKSDRKSDPDVWLTQEKYDWVWSRYAGVSQERYQRVFEVLSSTKYCYGTFDSPALLYEADGKTINGIEFKPIISGDWLSRIEAIARMIHNCK